MICFGSKKREPKKDVLLQHLKTSTDVASFYAKVYFPFQYEVGHMPIRIIKSGCEVKSQPLRRITLPRILSHMVNLG